MVEGQYMGHIYEWMLGAVRVDNFVREYFLDGPQEINGEN